VGRTEINAQGQNDLCYVSESLLGKLTGGTENPPIYRGSVNNLPMIQLSGALAPIETMPKLFQYLSLINPLRHYVTIIRGVLLKGVGLESLWIHVLALGFFAVLLLGISARRFRTQLS
jgi:hypothetical protein